MVLRSKRVTYPLDERAKDRMVGRDKPDIAYGSSGSEHSATTSQISGDSSSSSSARSLSYLVNRFEEEEEDDEKEDVIIIANDIDGCHKQNNDSDSDFDPDHAEAKHEEMNSTLCSLNGDHFRNILFTNVMKALEIFRNIITTNTQILNRNIMLYLQNLGYNAAICKTKWETCGGLTAGNHEFIDVVRSTDSDNNVRYFIDLNFAQEFDIARQTNQFQRFANKLPVVFVGKSNDLKVIVKLMSDEIRRSLKSRGLVLPPWRKNRFMQNKWFGPYRRTVNYIPSNILVSADNKASAVKCSMIGFNVVDNAPLLPRDNSYKII